MYQKFVVKNDVSHMLGLGEGLFTAWNSHQEIEEIHSFLLSLGDATNYEKTKLYRDVKAHLMVVGVYNYEPDEVIDAYSQLKEAWAKGKESFNIRNVIPTLKKLKNEYIPFIPEIEDDLVRELEDIMNQLNREDNNFYFTYNEGFLETYGYYHSCDDCPDCDYWDNY